MEPLGVFLLVALIVGGAWAYWHYRRIVVYDFQRALLYRNGRFQRVLDPGIYRYFKPWSRIDVVDSRRALISVPGQEILTKDLISLRMTLACGYRLADPAKALRDWTSYLGEFYLACQIAMRHAVADITLDTLLQNRAELDAALLVAVKDKAAEFGLEIDSVAVKDVMLPAGLKRAYAGVLEAQKEAQRRLEEARGEQAVLRNLANAARMYAEEPALVQARMIQALGQGGNTLVFGAEAEKTAARSKPAPNPRAKKSG